MIYKNASQLCTLLCSINNRYPECPICGKKNFLHAENCLLGKYITISKTPTPKNIRIVDVDEFTYLLYKIELHEEKKDQPRCPNCGKPKINGSINHDECCLFNTFIMSSEFKLIYKR